jgi:hypothetical protein
MNDTAPQRMGRPAILTEGKRVTLNLDAATIAAAKALGAGNVSLGVRRALEKLQVRADLDAKADETAHATGTGAPKATIL